ncbi:hypothetical protein K435DRAFT_970312 [Dendrothele bispora CBS 962.96]|uniref:GST N-terminal domain-containing protein n=1 Tax=Dendrothele bispora (strain CBS 962.96) TaxID=1314807 RepID=A0A4S8LC46_DENBC|nr:hypothetical protein K435DRAFT_970312 [Dendrothele bispora CBS 962.96]
MSSHRASSSVITLYDLKGGSGSSQPWAPNIWRVRFILNYKRLRYRTVWVDFPDVESILSSLGAPPSSFRSNGRPVYTLPVLVDPSRNPGRPLILSNTNNISEYLEATYPSKPVFPPGSRALQSLYAHYIQEVLAKPLLPLLVPLSHQQLDHRSQSYFRAPGGLTGPPSSATNQPLPPGPERERQWLQAKEQFDFLDSILAKNVGDGDGIVAMGFEVSYADFALCSVLMWIRQVALHDGWSRIQHWNGGRWEQLWQKCSPYMDNH